ncbi:RDD family protein [Erysipelotrichaceae bacterium HCN-30851]
MTKKKFYRKPICDVGMLKRFFAYIVDYYFGLLLCSLPIVLGNGLINRGEEMQMNLFFFKDQALTLYIIAFLSFFIGYVYYIHIPLKVWKGQTLAKHLFHFKIVKTNGEEVDLKSLLLRHAVGMFLIEGAVISCTSVLRQLLTYCTGINFVDSLIKVGLVLTFVSCVIMLFNSNRKMIHDYIGGTIVTSDSYHI